MRPPVRRELQIAGVSAAVGALLASGVAAALWPDGPAREMPTAMPIPSVPPEPSLSATITESTESPSSEPEPEPTTDSRDEDERDADREPAEAPPLAGAPPAGEGSLPDADPVSCPQPTTTVRTAEELTEALDTVSPGDVIALADGVYVGEFVATTSGTADSPIFLCGGRGAVLDGDGIKGGYVVHLDRAKYWRLVGFTVRNGQKGVMADGTVGSVIQDLTVEQIGDEAIHLRSNSTDNVVLSNTIRETGKRREKFGEGVYIGTAVSNWCRTNDCRPDRSDRNVVKDNDISRTTAEAVDIKEGTTGGVVAGNTFDGSLLDGVDSWVDVKGNNWLVAGNTGINSPKDGFQTHEILDGWGDLNVFRGNTATVNGPGLGFALRPENSNVVTCDNTVRNAGEGFSNADCR